MAWARRSFPAWVWIWSLVSIFLAFYDAAFILLRPMSTGHWLFKDYSQAYPPIDSSYRNDNVHDGLPYAIALVGGILNQSVVFASLLLMACSRPISAKLLLFGANCMITATTAMFLVSHALCMTLPEKTSEGLGSLPDIVDIHVLSIFDKPESFWCHTSHNDAQTFYTMFLTPNILFVVVPLLIVRSLWRDLSSMTYAKAQYNDKKTR